MNNNKLLYFLLILIINNLAMSNIPNMTNGLNNLNNEYDFTAVGWMQFAGSLTRLPIGWINTLADDIKINFVSTTGTDYINFQDVPNKVRRVAENTDKAPGKVSILFEHLWYLWSTPAVYMPASHIKIALSMIEGTSIPEQWVDILNNNFDAVIVPDEHLIKVYSESKVNIPVFFVPLAIDLEPFLEKPLKKYNFNNTPFYFGISAAFCSVKNHELVIKSFAKSFGNNNNIILRIHGRSGDPACINNIRNLIKELNLTNIELIERSLTYSEYIDFMSSLDCYILLSKAEGFSITPREAMALGMPCIISNNTAHKTICNTSLVKAVKSDILEPADYTQIFGCICGNHFNCSVDDAADAMLDVYNYYDVFKAKAIEAREWVKQYTYSNLKNKYLSLIKPKKVILSDKNIVTDDSILTRCPKLYKKYKDIQEQNA